MKGVNSWAKAIAINVIIIVLIFVFTDMSYETNDDYAISVRTLMGDPYTFFVNYYLCRFMIWLQAMIPSLNSFVLTQVAMSFVAFTCISALFFRKNRGFWASLIFVLIIGIFAFDHYSIIQFTKTSALLMVAGMIMLVDAMTQRLGAGYYIIAILLFWLGVSLRMQNAFVAIGFAGLYLIFWVIENRKRLVPEGYVRPAKLVSYLILLVLLAGSFGLYQLSNDINNSTPELKNYREYNDARSWVIDYSDFEHYDENRSTFDGMGLSENDLYLINNWYFDYNGAASLENLKGINRVYSKDRQASSDTVKKAVRKTIRHCISCVRDMSANGMQILLLVGIALSSAALMRPRYWIYLIVLGGATLMIYAGLFYMGRPAYRALYGVDLNAALWLLWYIEGRKCWGSVAAEDKDRAEEKSGSRGPVYMAYSIMKTIVTVAIVLILGASLVLCVDRSNDRFRSTCAGLRPAQLAEKIDSDRDKVYVFSTREKKNTESYAYPMRAPDPDENVFTFGGWGTLSPYLMGRMNDYGLDDLFEDIIDNENVYVIDSRNVERMEEYLSKWYGKGNGGRGKIEYRKTDEVDGTVIWQVVRSL